MNDLTKETYDDILNIDSKYFLDESIEEMEYHQYTPQTQANNNKASQPITIAINGQESYTLPSKSYISIKGQIRRRDNNTVFAEDAEITLINNAMMYLFSAMKYDLSGTVIESINYPGQVSSMLGYLSQPDDFNTSSGLKYCWCKDTTTHACSAKYTMDTGKVTADNPEYNQGFANRRSFLFSSNPRGHFSFIIPLSHCFGFAEYRKVVYGWKHTLTLTRDSDNLALYRTGGNDGKVDVTEIIWHMPQVKIKLDYLARIRSINEKKIPIPLAFRARTSDCTNITQTREYTWRLSVNGGIEKPRWIIIGFQTGKTDGQEVNPALFDHCDLQNAYVTLNSDRYPQTEISTNFAVNDYAKLYDMFDEFKKEYYGIDSLVGGTQVSVPDFKKLFPILVFDVRRQKEKLKTNVVDMQVRLFFRQNVPANTTAYSIVISDRFFTLSPDGTHMNVLSM